MRNIACVGLAAIVCTGAAGFTVLASQDAHAQIPRGACMASDPTGTLLHVRGFPNGPVTNRIRHAIAARAGMESPCK